VNIGFQYREDHKTQTAAMRSLIADFRAIGCHVDLFPTIPQKQYDICVFWNGLCNWQRRYVSDNPAQRFLFVEHGWFPQTPYIQIDPLGVNAYASWIQAPVSFREYEPTYMQSSDFLVVLQDDNDTQIRIPYLNPLKLNMASWLKILATVSPSCNIRVRAHPKHKTSDDARRIVDETKNMYWDDSPDLKTALESVGALLTINSSCGVEALAMKKVIVTYGRSIWSSVQGASMNMVGSELSDQCDYVMGGLRDGILGVNRYALQYAFERIMSKQMLPGSMQCKETLNWLIR